jgi:3-methyladenine DNA glycosylase Mpg
MKASQLLDNMFFPYAFVYGFFVYGLDWYFNVLGVEEPCAKQLKPPKFESDC